MTREEAIKYLKEMKDECNDTIHKVRYVTQEEALEMAIKALEQEPSGDLISRQAVLMELDKYLCGVPFDEKGIDEVIKDLPSVNPQEPNCPYYVIDDDGHGLCKNHRVLEQEPKSPCDLCRYNPPSSADGKPCTMCPATGRSDKE